MDEIISYKMCAVKVRNAKLRDKRFREPSDKRFDDFKSDICIVMCDGCPMTLSSVWLGNMYECRQKLISAQFGKVI